MSPMTECCSLIGQQYPMRWDNLVDQTLPSPCGSGIAHETTHDHPSIDLLKMVLD